MDSLYLGNLQFESSFLKLFIIYYCYPLEGHLVDPWWVYNGGG